MGKILKLEFFDRNSVVVAKDLLGKNLIRIIKGKKVSNKITEVEAYEGLDDKASHAHRGQTPRNTPMFGESGTIYVYFTYGMHWMFNITCGKKGHPAAVLIRGVEECIGPGRLTKKLFIDKTLNGKMLSRRSGLWVEEGEKIAYSATRRGGGKFKIIKTPRIGINSSGSVWSKKLYRFILQSKSNE